MINILTAAAIVTGVGVCIENELDATPESGGGPVRTPGMRTCLLVPGNVAWDGCECGQLALTIQGIWPTKVFPNDASADPIMGGCMVRPLAVNVLVSITRCIPGMTSGMPPAPPTCAALLAAALEQQGDAFAVRKAVECCLATMKSVERRILDFRVGRTTFTGPDGGCGGSELAFTFELL